MIYIVIYIAVRQFGRGNRVLSKKIAQKADGFESHPIRFLPLDAHLPLDARLSFEEIWCITTLTEGPFDFLGLKLTHLATSSIATLLTSHVVAVYQHQIRRVATLTLQPES